MQEPPPLFSATRPRTPLAPWFAQPLKNLADPLAADAVLGPDSLEGLSVPVHGPDAGVSPVIAD